MADDEVIVPIVHMNGTSKKELLEVREAVYTKLYEVERALARMGPNGRDYYPQDGLMTKAEDQHRKRMDVLAYLRRQIETEIESIDEQHDPYGRC